MNNITKTVKLSKNYTDSIYCAMNNPFVPQIPSIICDYSDGSTITIDFVKNETRYMPIATLTTYDGKTNNIEIPDFRFHEFTMQQDNNSYTMLFKIILPETNTEQDILY